MSREVDWDRNSRIAEWLGWKWVTSLVGRGEGVSYFLTEPQHAETWKPEYRFDRLPEGGRVDPQIRNYPDYSSDSMVGPLLSALLKQGWMPTEWSYDGYSFFTGLETAESERFVAGAGRTLGESLADCVDKIAADQVSEGKADG